MWYTLTLLPGIVLLIFSIFKCYESLRFLKTSDRTTGRVIELEAIHDSDGTTYKAVFAFITKDNRSVTFRQSGSSRPASFRVDEEVTVAYDPNHPGEARVLSYFGVFSWTIILMALAIPAIVIGGGYHLAQLVLK